MSKEPFVIVRDTFNLRIHDVDSLQNLPLTTVRKMWKIMFSAPWENEQTIEQVRHWLSTVIAKRKDRIPQAEAALKSAKAAAAQKHSDAAIMGDGYWAGQIAKLKRQQKAVEKGALSYIGANEIAERLATAIVQRDAPKLADRAVKDAQTRLTGDRASYEKALKLQTIFNDMAAQAGL